MRGCCVLFLSVLLSLPSFAQTEIKPTDVTATPLDEIGNRNATRPVETIDSSILQSDQRPSFTDALNEVSGVQSRLSSPLLSIRGSQSSTRILVFEDGVPLNFLDGVGFNPLFIAQENLGRVILLRGPSSSLFGHDALAGTVEFKSLLLDSPRVYATEGSFNTQQLFAGLPWKTNLFTVQATAYQSHTDGNFPFSIPRTGGTATRSRNDSETLRTTIQVSGNALENSVRWRTYHLLARQIGSTPDSLETNLPQSFNNWGQLAFLGVEFKPNENFWVGSRTSYKIIDQRYNDVPLGRSIGLGEGLSIVKKFDELEVEIFDDYATESFQASYFSSGQQSLGLNEVGISGLLPLSSQWTFQSILRVSSETGGLVPSVGLNGITSDQWKVFFNYAEGYHPASVSQKFARFQGFVPNPSLNAEHSDEISMGFEKPLHGILVHAEVFSREIYSLIDNRVVTPGIVTPQNTGRAKAFGADGKLSTDWQGFRTTLNLGYLNNRALDPEGPLALSPEIQAGLVVEKKWDRWTVSLQDTQWSHYDDRSIISGQLVELSGWNTLDLFAGYTFSEGISAKLAVLNSLDQPRELRIGYPEPQRSFTLTVEAFL